MSKCILYYEDLIDHENSCIHYFYNAEVNCSVDELTEYFEDLRYSDRIIANCDIGGIGPFDGSEIPYLGRCELFYNESSMNKDKIEEIWEHILDCVKEQYEVSNVKVETEEEEYDE